MISKKNTQNYLYSDLTSLHKNYIVYVPTKPLPSGDPYIGRKPLSVIPEMLGYVKIYQIANTIHEPYNYYDRPMLIEVITRYVTFKEYLQYSKYEGYYLTKEKAYYSLIKHSRYFYNLTKETQKTLDNYKITHPELFI